MIPAGYRGHAEVLARLARHGAVAVGSTVEQLPIACARFGPPDAARVSVVIAGLHPIEWIGVETALALVDRLAAEPPRDRTVLVFAMANPDGYRRIERDLEAGRRRFRRTNTRGVDLNRNWPTGFVAIPRWLPARALGLNYPGEAPCSEAEVAAIVHALDAEVARGASIDTALSLHSFGRKLLIPYGNRWRRSPRHAELYERARRVRDRLVERYTIDQVSRWVPGAFVYGMEIDHLHERYGACALLVECAFGGWTTDPASWVSPFRWYNPRRPSHVAGDLARAVEPFVRGT